MPKSCIFKIIMGGSSGVGKTTFLNGAYYPFNDEAFYQIGVSFKLIDCFINNEDSYLLQIWDFKCTDRFQDFYPSFCRGAKGAILCFDITNYDSFKDLSYWIEVIRESAGSIPVILIATKMDLDNRVVTNEEIDIFMLNYNVKNVFFNSRDINNQEMIFTELISEIDYPSKISEISLFLPKFDKDFESFMKYFSICPICEENNHFNYLKRFYFSKNQNSTKLREQLFNLMELSKKKISIGIPCCNCYKKYFKNNEIISD